MIGPNSGGQILYLELPHQARLIVAYLRWPTLLQTCATELNIYEELCHCFHQYLAFAGFIHRTLEGHRKEDVTSKVLDSPFINLNQGSDSNEELMLIG